MPEIHQTLESASPPSPAGLRIAAILLAFHGLLVAATALRLVAMQGLEDPSGFMQAIGRGMFSLMLAWGLHRRQRWAWWLAVLFGGFLMVAGWGGIVTILVVTGGQMSPLAFFSGWQLLALLTSLLTLSAAIILLVTPAVRRALHNATSPSA